jgi:hypothetical protein
MAACSASIIASHRNIGLTQTAGMRSWASLILRHLTAGFSSERVWEIQHHSERLRSGCRLHTLIIRLNWLLQVRFNRTWVRLNVLWTTSSLIKSRWCLCHGQQRGGRDGKTGMFTWRNVIIPSVYVYCSAKRSLLHSTTCRNAGGYWQPCFLPSVQGSLLDYWYVRVFPPVSLFKVCLIT